MRVVVIIPAAGTASRYSAAGGSNHKLDEHLAGKPVLHHAIDCFAGHDAVTGLIVAGPHDQSAYSMFQEMHSDVLRNAGATVCRGGPSFRWETVRNALVHVPSDATHIAVHDAARPCTPAAVIDRVFQAGRSYAAVIPGVPVADTLRRVNEDPAKSKTVTQSGDQQVNQRQIAGETVDRDGLFAIQTPQLFEADLLRRTYRQDSLDSTDDAGLVQAFGHTVHIVLGDASNIKITTPADLDLARAILQNRSLRDRGP